MLQAVELASRGQWSTTPNPCVGALILSHDDEVLAEGYHHAYGQAHAEVNALAAAREKGVDLQNATLVITLEPCAHKGHTPPCTDAILASGIKKVVIGCLDPNPKAAGGAEILRQNGLDVEVGVAERECGDLIADFVTWQTTALPYTILKLASTLDGRIATRTGHSQWISAGESRKEVHRIRRHMGAIIVGGNTFYQDNPRLTCRPQDDEPEVVKQPLAVVVTSRLPPAEGAFNLLRERPEETIFWTTVAAAASPKAEALRKRGVRIYGLPLKPKGGSTTRVALDLRHGLELLRNEFGCYYTMCEGGGKLGTSLLEDGMAHELHLHYSPKILGDGEATSLFDGRSPSQMDEAIPLHILETRLCGSDIIIKLRSEAQYKQPAAHQESSERN